VDTGIAQKRASLPFVRCVCRSQSVRPSVRIQELSCRWINVVKLFIGYIYQNLSIKIQVRVKWNKNIRDYLNAHKLFTPKYVAHIVGRTVIDTLYLTFKY
jgi:hypothetical protein